MAGLKDDLNQKNTQPPGFKALDSTKNTQPPGFIAHDSTKKIERRGLEGERPPKRVTVE